MVTYNRELGRHLAEKYLKGLEIKLFASPFPILEHAQKVGELCYDYAKKIIAKNPEFNVILDPELVGFLGHVANIGYRIRKEAHELHTIYLLENKEKIPHDIAIKASHGQLVETLGNNEEYYPVGIEGILLTYIDIAVRNGPIIAMDERAKEIESQIKGQSISEENKKEALANFAKALNRYKRYEKIIKSLLD